MFSGLLDRLVDTAPGWLLLAAFVLPFMESIPLVDAVAPGDVGVTVLGAATAGRAELLVPVIITAALGCFAGDCFSYWLGRRWGRPLLEHTGALGRRLTPAADRAERYFKQRGAWLVFAARWIGVLRGVVPFVVGTAHMPFPTFVAWAAPAAILWCTTLVTLGFAFGDEVADLLDRGGWVVLLVGVVILAGASAFRRLRASRSRSRSGTRTR